MDESGKRLTGEMLNKMLNPVSKKNIYSFDTIVAIMKIVNKINGEMLDIDGLCMQHLCHFLYIDGCTCVMFLDIPLWESETNGYTTLAEIEAEIRKELLSTLDDLALQRQSILTQTKKKEG